MAYIKKERVAEIRKQLKEEFKNIKFSVVREHYSSVNISIMSAPFKFTDKDYTTVSMYHISDYENAEILQRIHDIANEGNYNRSDAMSDYFDVGFYVNIRIGKYDQPFKLVETKPIKEKKIRPAKVKTTIKQSFFSKLKQCVNIF